MLRRSWTMVVVFSLWGCQVSGLGVPPQAPGRYVLTPRDGVTLDALAHEVEAQGGQVAARLQGLNLLEVQAPDPAFVDRLGEWVDATASAVVRQRVHLGRSFVAAADDLNFQGAARPGPEGEPLSGYQWSLEVAHVRQAWKAGYHGRGTLVAVLDTGVDPDQPDLRAHLDLLHARSFVPAEPDIVDYHGHGTHVAGLIGAIQNGQGVIGVAPMVQILPIKVLDTNGDGDDWQVMRGIDYAVSQGVSIINLSLDGLWPRDAAGARLAAAYQAGLRHAASRGALVVMAAGNEGMTFPDPAQLELPAGTGAGLVVGATGPVGGQNPDGFAPYSNLGAGFLSLVAPGGGMSFDPTTMAPLIQLPDLMLSTWSTHARPRDEMGFHVGPGRYAWMAGTSQAAAFASGVAALAREAHGPQHPELLAQELKAACVPLGDPALGAGRLDAGLATR